MRAFIARWWSWRLLALCGAALLIVAWHSGIVLGAEGDEPAKTEESVLSYIFRASGLVGLGILFISLYFVATVVRLFLEIRERNAAPPEQIQAAEELIKQRDFRTLYKVLKESDSYLGRVLSVGISELTYGLPEAREAMEREGDAGTAQYERMTTMLAVIGTLGPMIGLLGTLLGMMDAFKGIAHSGNQVQVNVVADGISRSLILTFEGVALSIPAIFFFALFRNRISAVTTNTSLLADDMLRRIFHSAQWKAPPQQPVAGPVR